MKIRKPLVFWIFFALPLSSCASSSSTKTGATAEKSFPARPMSAIEVAPPSLMVAKKIERPLIIVLDPARVADVQGPVKWSFTRYDITEFNLFVTRDIKRAMSRSSPTYRSIAAIAATGCPL